LTPPGTAPASGAWTEVDLGRLEANARALVGAIGPDCQVVAVVKADAYGHGLVPAARAFAAGGVRAFGVLLPREALELRGAAIDAPVWILGPTAPSELGDALAAGAVVSIGSAEEADALEAEGARRGDVLPYHLKVDTGMGRLGVPVEDLPAFLERLRGLRRLAMDGIYSHLACADEPAHPLNRRQRDAFGSAVAAVRAAGHSPRYAHLANTAAALADPATRWHAVRLGLGLYGYAPGPAVALPAAVAPALSLRCRVLQVKRVPAGASVGYGATWVAGRETLVATIPLGYDDGYLRGLSGCGAVLARGRRAAVIGRISMDLATIDVTGLPAVRPGEIVTVLGQDGAERIDAWELAGLAGTIPWEILCALGKKRPRIELRQVPPAAADAASSRRAVGCV